MRTGPNLEPRMHPCCGYVTDACDELPGFEEGTPNLGDLTICFNCGAILVFTKGGSSNKTRPATRKDIESLNSRERRLLGRAQRYVLRRGRILKLS